MARENGKRTVGNVAYATAADFKQIFTEDINSLHLLSLLLTGNPEKLADIFFLTVLCTWSHDHGERRLGWLPKSITWSPYGSAGGDRDLVTSF